MLHKVRLHLRFDVADASLWVFGPYGGRLWRTRGSWSVLPLSAAPGLRKRVAEAIRAGRDADIISLHVNSPVSDGEYVTYDEYVTGKGTSSEIRRVGIVAYAGVDDGK